MSTTQEATDHQFLVYLTKNQVKPGLYFMSIPNDFAPRPKRSYFAQPILIRDSIRLRKDKAQLKQQLYACHYNTLLHTNHT
jgi:hypothetical protein